MRQKFQAYFYIQCSENACGKRLVLYHVTEPEVPLLLLRTHSFMLFPYKTHKE